MFAIDRVDSESISSHVVNFSAHISLLFNYLACGSVPQTALTITIMRFSAFHVFFPFFVIVLGLTQVAALLQPEIVRDLDLRRDEGDSEGEY
jgi:hypothetical protein